MKLEPASLTPPVGLLEVLSDLGAGENGFGGTPVSNGEATLADFLQRCCDLTDPAKVPAGFVPQSIFWALDADGIAVGMVRMRHYLNDKLRIRGGHIGFYIRRDRRQRGYAKEALRL